MQLACFRLLAKKIAPPFKPSVVRPSLLLSIIYRPYAVALQSGLIDVSNFDQEFTSEAATDSVVVESNLSETVQDQFKGFTYNPSNDLLSETPQFGSILT